MKTNFTELRKEFINGRTVVILLLLTVIGFATQCLEWLLGWAISTHVPIMYGWFTYTLLNIAEWSLWAYISFWLTLPDCPVEVKENKALILIDKLNLATESEPLRGQRVVYGGVRLKYPFWEVRGPEIDLEWQQIDIPASFKAKTEDGVEVKFTGYQRYRVKDPLKYNLHKPDDIRRIFEGRITKFLTEKVVKIKSDDLPGQIVNLMKRFTRKFSSKKIDVLEATYGIETEGFQLNDVEMPKKVEIANQVNKVLGEYRKVIRQLIKDSIIDGKPTLSWRDAMLMVSIIAGEGDANVTLFEVANGAFGGGKKTN